MGRCSNSAGLLCSRPAAPCCDGFVVSTGYDGYQYCAPSTKGPVREPGSNGCLPPKRMAPVPITGICGSRAEFRYCYPSGCQCPVRFIFLAKKKHKNSSGSHTRAADCEETACMYPRASCCAGYTKTLQLFVGSEL